MNGIEKSLNNIAETILHIDEASLTALWDNIKAVSNIFSVCRMGKAVIIFSIINALERKMLSLTELLKNNNKNKTNPPSDSLKEKHY
jgi:hypothetical protein